MVGPHADLFVQHFQLRLRPGDIGAIECCVHGGFLHFSGVFEIFDCNGRAVYSTRSQKKKQLGPMLLPSCSSSGSRRATSVQWDVVFTIFLSW